MGATVFQICAVFWSFLATNYYCFSFKLISFVFFPGAENEPAPCQYNREKADHLVMRSAPSFSMSHRHQKTTLGKLIGEWVGL